MTFFLRVNLKMSPMTLKTELWQNSAQWLSFFFSIGKVFPLIRNHFS